MSEKRDDCAVYFGEYRASLEGLRFSEVAKARMAERLAERAAVKDESDERWAVPRRHARANPSRRRWSIAAAAACLAIAIGLGGIAYAVVNGLVSAPQLAEHLFGSESSVEVVDRIGRPVGVSQSRNGVTVSADAIIGDRTNVAVVFSITNDDGTAFDVEALDNGILPMGFTGDVHVDFGPLPVLGGLGATGWSYIYDADPSDGSLQLVEIRSYEGGGNENVNLIGRTMTVHLAELYRYADEGRILVAEGPWDLSFPLQYEDASVDLPIGQSFDLNGVAATVDELTASPFALHLRYTADQKVEWTSGEPGRLSAHDSELADRLLGVQVTLHMSDGSVLEMAGNGGGAITADGDAARCEASVFFDRIVDLDQVESVSICGIMVELP